MSRIITVTVWLLTILFVASCNTSQITPEEYAAKMGIINPARLQVLGEGIGFPFHKRDHDEIREIRAYGIRPWGGEIVHNGVDIILDNRDDVGRHVAVIAPVSGIIHDVLRLKNPQSEEPGMEQWILVVIEVNPSLWVTLSFEPKTTKPHLQQQQEELIKVAKGDKVKKGDELGKLVVGEGSGDLGSGNPHIDLRILLKSPLTSLADIMEIDFTREAHHNNVSELPTFLCPYDYSDMRAKQSYEVILSAVDRSRQCGCACRFPYNTIECGSGCTDRAR